MVVEEVVVEVVVAGNNPMNNNKCVVIVPALKYIEHETENCLRLLEDEGYEIWRYFGCASIDFIRSKLATKAMKDGFDEIVWIDSDMIFNPEDVDKLRSHDRRLVTGIYSRREEGRGFACNFDPDSEGKKIILGKGGGLIKLAACGAGFLYTHRVIYEMLALKMPVCNEAFGEYIVPFFMPMIINHPVKGHWYLRETYAFCHHVKQLGIQIIADTSIRLYHIGNYYYGWENAGSYMGREDSIECEVKGVPPSFN